MVRQSAPLTANLEASMGTERTRLVRLCARLTGDVDAAQDLAQETLLEAWRNIHKLRHPAGYPQWLAAIAHNICRRWMHRRGREQPHLVRLETDADPTAARPTLVPIDDFDIELELERQDLAHLLDRAMALLAPDTRALLIARYVEQSPLADVAAHLGISEGAMKMKLHRGKLALRRVLTTDLIDEAAAYGLIDGANQHWHETRIWCTLCGQHRLQGCFTMPDRQLWLRCVKCHSDPGSSYHQGGSAEFFAGIKSFKPALNRVSAALNEFYQHGTAGHMVRCEPCGRAVPLRIGHNENSRLALHYVEARCPACNTTLTHSTLSAIILGMPAGQRFWREHTRIRALPEHEVEAAGCAAIAGGFESAVGPATLQVVAMGDTFQVLGIQVS
jgi:RNA polymerase sigma factor (sigma-70 family)